VLVCAIEGDGVPSTDLAAPSARWGTADIQIVGRAALLAANASGHDALVVNGRHLAAGAVRVNHDLSQPLIRSGGMPRRASRPFPAATGAPPGTGTEEQDDVWNSRIR
jgi:hypothetical protein